LRQWRAPRLAAIKTGTGIDILAAVRAGKGDIQSQVEAAWWELNNVLVYAKAKGAIDLQATAYGAATQACVLFEQAGAAEAAQRRGKIAERWSAHFAKNGF
jgi:Phage tail lysozyme